MNETALLVVGKVLGGLLARGGWSMAISRPPVVPCTCFGLIWMIGRA